MISTNYGLASWVPHRAALFVGGTGGEPFFTSAKNRKSRCRVIIKHKYTRALEIGTSTGHSSIWIAWALSKTDGKLITIEIDESRYKKALENFEKAGLSQYIDARLADAHELVPRLKGPFDFVFSDADKDWYKKYFDFVAPKLVIGGCYTTHNVSDRWGSGLGQGGYAGYLKSLKNFETTFNDSGAGVAISFKKSEK
ncbi:MAG: O-methyltransferase [Desulfomonilaceae bacterium]